jgi:Tol biopolymer transport system component
VTGSPAPDDAPAWSPDGGWLVVRSFRSGYDGEIWKIRADGTGAANLTPKQGAAVLDHRRPDWSPDGTTLAFVDQPTLRTRPEIWLMRPDGSEPAARPTTTPGTAG